MTIGIDINDVLRDTTGQFIKMYQKVINPDFEIELENVTDFDFLNVFPFLDENNRPSRMNFNKFKYEDCAFELYGRTPVMSRTLASDFNLWTQNTLMNFDKEKTPEIILFSPFEMNLSIQSTLSFLACFGCRVRNIEFPTDSFKMWDKCDAIITANPNLLNAKPEGKISFKIEAPYNKEAKADHVFASMEELIKDENNTLITLIENA